MRVTLRDLGKSFAALTGRTEALGGVDLEIASGELFVLLGPSGCGKSTLLNLLAGLERPSRGEILFGGRTVASAGGKVFLSARKRNVAMVFQSYALYPHLSVYDNIAFPLRVEGQGRGEVEPTVREAAAVLEIEPLLQSRPGELSGGQRQRVAIARAIVRKPDLFLLDEPLSNLDAQLRASTRVELKRLQRRLGVTTVYVTHDQVEAMTLGDRIALLRQGRIEQVGAPRELYERPATPFAAGFVGTPPMNLLPVERGRGGWRFPGGAAPIPLPDEDENRPFTRGLVGIRPEDIRLVSPGAGAPLRGRIESVEPLGREDLLHVRCGREDLTILSSGGRRAGEEVGVEMNLDKIHFFAEEGSVQAHR